MKRLRSWLLALTIIAAALAPSLVRAADGQTISIIPADDKRDVLILTVAWTAAGDGSKADITISAANLAGYCARMAAIDPGATAPADNYDMTISDSLGVDIFGGALADLDTSTSEQRTPLIGGAYGCRLVDGNGLTMAFANVTNADATGTIKVYFQRM